MICTVDFMLTNWLWIISKLHAISVLHSSVDDVLQENNPGYDQIRRIWIIDYKCPQLVPEASACITLNVDGFRSKVEQINPIQC